MSDSTGQVLGASTAGIVLPAAISKATGINFLYLLTGFVLFIVMLNIAMRLAAKYYNK